MALRRALTGKRFVIFSEREPNYLLVNPFSLNVNGIALSFPGCPSGALFCPLRPFFLFGWKGVG